jgi:hypothetical protein
MRALSASITPVPQGTALEGYILLVGPTAATAVFVAVATSTLTAANVGIGISDQSGIHARQKLRP